AMDHAHHRAAGRTAGHLRSVSLFFPSQLCRGRGRDCAVAPRAASAMAGSGLHPAERRGAHHPPARGAARAVDHQRAVRRMTVLQDTRTDVPAAATWVAFLSMCVGMFMAILDIQVVATSLPTIQKALGISPDAMSWIQTAYLIAEVIAIPLTGLFTRVLSLRFLFVVAVTAFTLASIGCAWSGDFTVLLVFRVLQGFA